MASEVVDLINSPGIIRDFPVHRLTKNAFSDGKNAKFTEDGAQPTAGDRAVLSETNLVPNWIAAFPPITNPNWIYGTDSELWVIDGDEHTEITRTSSNYNGIATERWNSCFLNGVGLFNNTIDIPQVWTEFDRTVPLIDLPNWDATRRCKSLRSFKNFLIALDMTDSGVRRPYRIVWSHPAAPGEYPISWDTEDPTKDSREIDLAETGDHLVDSLPLGNLNIVYKETSTWGMQYIGAPFYFRFYNILPTQGLLVRDCVVAMPKGHVVCTQDDIILHEGVAQQSVSILDTKIRKWLFSSIDPDNFRNCFMFADNFKDEVWFCFPEVGNIYATKAIIWDWSSNSLGIRDLNNVPFIAVGPVGDSLVQDVEWG